MCHRQAVFFYFFEKQSKCNKKYKFRRENVEMECGSEEFSEVYFFKLLEIN